MNRVLTSTAAALALLAAAAPAPAATTPVTGNWEGVGPHGLPLSFELATRHGRMLATHATFALPLSCPAEARNTDAIPLKGLTYSAGDTVTISGRSGAFNYNLSGTFATSRSGTFSTITTEHVGCGWPTHRLAWKVQPARRRTVADGVWRGTASGLGIRAGRLRLAVGAGGRVLTDFAAALPCARGGGRTFDSPGVDNFIAADGTFRSPLTGQRINTTETRWVGRFDGRGAVSGELRIADPCGSGVARVQFRATHGH